jgi:hypothetical protein
LDAYLDKNQLVRGTGAAPYLTGVMHTMPKPKGDEFTADHQPQAAIFKYAAGLPYFNAAGVQNMKKHAAGQHADAGIAINLHENRHKEGRTFKNKESQLKHHSSMLLKHSQIPQTQMKRIEKS